MNLSQKKLIGKKGNKFLAEYVTLFNRMKQRENSRIQMIYKEWNIQATFAGDLKLATEQAEQLEKQKPKVDYFNSQVRNSGLMTTTEIAKDYGWSAARLNQELHKCGIIYQQGSGHRKVWVVYRDYANKGYAQYEPFTYQNGVSKVCTIILSGRKKVKSLSTTYLQKMVSDQH